MCSARRDGLAADGVDIAGVASDTGIASGIAVIEVSDAAENTIIVAPGANGRVGADELARLGQALDGASALLLQLEVPLDTVVAAAQAARARGVLVLLDPAPAQALPPALYTAADIITPNETEAAALVGFAIDDVAAAEHAARALLARGVGRAVIKLGARGAFWHDGLDGGFAPAFKVAAIDTVAAGDAFNAGLAAGLDAGLPFGEAIGWGMAAGALATTRAGAQPSLPSRAAVLDLLGTPGV